jgi:membrane-bound lytic murein transglycosylase B
MKRQLLSIFMIASLAVMMPLHTARAASFDAWLVNFKAQARAQGISDATLKQAFDGVRPIPRVIELDRKQPERKIGFDEYQAKTLSAQRVAEGRRLLTEHWSTLKRIEKQYGVQAQYIVSLWGMETSYGRNTGGFDIIASLATLAYDGRRGDYFRTELIKALKILQDGHVAREDFKGSWAGAMGQVQFMPSSWKAYAVDDDGDGHRDIWTSKADAFASAANYLSQRGWQYGQSWGQRVQIPAGFSKNLIDRNVKKTSFEWARLGVRDAQGNPLKDMGATTFYLVEPRGGAGKVFLGGPNLQTIMSWNNSNFFAITVGELADKIAKKDQGHKPVTDSPAASPYHHYNN